MIIPKELIDASINSKLTAQETKDKALLAAIKSRIPDMQALPGHVDEIMQTYYYVSNRDKTWGEQLWTAMCSEADAFHLCLCNAVNAGPKENIGIRINSFCKDCFTHIYVTTKRVVFIPGDKWMDGLGTGFLELSDIDSRLATGHYERMLQSMDILINGIPAYRERIADVLKDIIRS